MICNRQKRILAAAFLSGSLLLQNIPSFAASTGATEWLWRSPFSKDISVSNPSTEETETAQTEIETSHAETETTQPETEAVPETNPSGETPSVKIEFAPANTLMASMRSEEFVKILEAVTLTHSYEIDLTRLNLSWEQLEKELTYRINSYAAQWSLYLKDLSTDNIICINDRAQESASLIKLYVMGAVMQCIQDGELERTETIDRLLRDMITVSDNTATNELVRYLDPGHDHRQGLETLNAFIDDQGFENTHEYNGLEDTSLHYSPETINTTSVKDCGTLLEDIYRGEFISHFASRDMENLLLDQQVTYKIPSAIPSESTVANKTGETSDCENDAAIVYTPKGDYILCIMSYRISSKDAAVDNIRELSALIYDYFMNDKEVPETASEEWYTS